MRVSTRLYLTAVPSVTGILIVAALAYWGQYAYVVPQLVVIVSAVAVIVSLFLSWRNARYVAHRIERLAGDRKSLPAKPFVGSVLLSSGEDELDTIEGVVDNLSDAVVRAETVRSESENAAFKRVRDYATMLSSVADESAARLDEVRLPLHILLENHFGDLNENQEEMLAAARSAAELVDADLVALREIAELDLGRQELRRDRLFPADMIRSLMPTLQAMADKKHARLALTMEPVVPAIRGDQPRLQE
jgi:signal transduction histidine kinase